MNPPLPSATTLIVSSCDVPVTIITRGTGAAGAGAGVAGGASAAPDGSAGGAGFATGAAGADAPPKICTVMPGNWPIAGCVLKRADRGIGRPHGVLGVRGVRDLRAGRERAHVDGKCARRARRGDLSHRCAADLWVVVERRDGVHDAALGDRDLPIARYSAPRVAVVSATLVAVGKVTVGARPVVVNVSTVV